MKKLNTLKRQTGELKAVMLFLLIIAISVPVFAQVKVPFTQRTSQYSPYQKIYSIKGDFSLIGNTNMTLVSYGDNTANSNNDMRYIDIDGIANTFNSSSATLNFNSENGSLPECTNIIYAGLYWTGRAHNGESPNIFDATKEIPNTAPQPVNENFTVTHNQSIIYTNYKMTVSRQGTTNAYYPRYTFTSTGEGGTVIFESLLSTATPNYQVRYSTDGGSTWIIPTNQVISTPQTNRKLITFDPVTIYSQSGGIVLKVNQLFRDARNDRDVSDTESRSIAYGNVSGTATPATITLTKTFDKGKVYLKHATEGSYAEVDASSMNFTNNIYYPTNGDGYMYSAFAEVTEYVRQHGIGEYSVADIALQEGNGGSTGYYGGWGMIVIYENDKMKWRDITVFDGHAYVYDEKNSDVMTEYELPISGFQTVQNGHVKMKYGLIAGEGDMYLSSTALDRFQVRNHSNTNWVNLTQPSKTEGNFFNSSIYTGGNGRSPEFTNNTGMDIIMDTVPNINNSVVTNNQTSTKFKYSTNQDTYVIFCIAMAVDAYIPEAEGLISTLSIDGITPGTEVFPGQEIEYTVEIRNKGTEPINNAILTIPIPYTGEYVSSSGIFYEGLTGNQPALAANAGANGSIVWNFGHMPILNPDTRILGKLTFKIRVTDNCFILSNPNCPVNIPIQGSTSGIGAISGVTFTGKNFILGYTDEGQCIGEPIIEPILFPINATDYIAQHCSDQNYSNQLFTYCNLSESTIPFFQVIGNFPAGSRYFDDIDLSTGKQKPTSIEFTSSNSFPSTNGSITYYAIPPGETGCYFTFTIKVTNIQTIPLSESTVEYCMGETAVPLTAIPSNPDYELFFYTSETGTIAFSEITPLTEIAGTTEYWVAEGISGQCIGTDRAKITVNVNACCTLNNASASSTPIDCNGGNSSVTITADGGNAPLSFILGSFAPQESGLFNNIPAGTYTWSVTETGAGCSPKTGNITITEPDVLSASAVQDNPVVCNSEANGAATITVSGGNGIYSYSWDKSASTIATAADLVAGLHSITITDSKGCTTIATVTVTEPVTLTCSVNQDSPVTISGASDGVATVIPYGGNGNYSYLWDNGETTASAVALNAGSHSVTITDSKGCETSCSVLITEPGVLYCSIIQNTPVVCNGEANASAKVTASGGVGPYTYLWDNSETSQTAVALNAGLHSVKVTDANGAISNCNITITEPNELSASAVQNNPVACNGQANGAATVTVSGGNGGYSYSWDKSVSTSASASDLAAGLHTITITDNEGCSTSATVTITEPDELSASAIQDNPVACNGEANGTATVTVSGGNGIYSYSWDKSASTSATAVDLVAGFHTITITDGKGCTTTATVTITEPNELTASAIQVNPVVCKGEANGVATINVSGGNGSYSYSWDKSASTSATAADLTAGLHTITITDSEGCNTTANVTITEPNVLSASAVQDNPVVCNSEANGAATVTVSGGNGIYSYSWDKSASTSATAADLVAGLHTITITDSKGCTTTATVTITEPVKLTCSVNQDSPVSISGASDGVATVSPAGGNGGYAYLWDNGETTASAVALNAGSHLVTVTDSKGCETSCSVLITEPGALYCSIIQNNPVVCNGEANASAIVTASGGVGPYSYLWDNSETSQTAVALNAGLNSVTVTDANGAISNCNITITEPNELTASASQDNPAACNGQANGDATVIVSGGNGGYSYSWDKSVSTTASASDLAAGLHTITITDSKGCKTTATVTISEPDILKGTDVQAACDSYTWIDGNTYTESNNTATFTLQNAAGCDSLVTLNLTINKSTTGTDVQAACDSYTWIDGNTYTESNNTATFTLTNAAGCDSVVTLNLTINKSTTGTDVQAACDSYTWIDGNTYTESNNAATFTLQNAAGCDSVVTLNLTINKSTTGTDVQAACDSYTWIDGNTYAESNNAATFTLTNAAGCDSVVTLNLTINKSTTGTDVQAACDSYTWIDGNTYTESNNAATFTLQNAAGCDSVVTLNLTINKSTTGTDVQAACDSYTWIDGNTYTESNNTATFTLQNAAGCDSVVTLNLTINKSTTGTDVQAACDSYTWIDGNTYTESNNAATFTLQNAAGCDSVVTLNLTINKSTTGTDVQAACDSYTWIDSNTYTESNNTATFTLQNAAGCDSVVTLNLTINKSTIGTDVQAACDSYTWIDGNTYTESNNTATFTLQNAAGCDSVVTLNLTINKSTIGTDVQAACDSYTWIDGNTYTESNNAATFTLQNAAGCDSVVTLNLTINKSTTGTDVQAACDSYTWIDGNTYAESNNAATFTLTNAAGCDSVVTLNLTINKSTTGTDVQAACDSYTWIDGNTYTESNNAATFTLQNAAGCDSVVTLNLTINKSTTGTDVQAACDSYTWIDGNTYTESNNTATFTLQNAAGCDSVVTLNLTINKSTTGTDVQAACDSYTWIDGNTYTESNNAATFTLQNAAGCDSVVTLNLTINKSTTGTDVQAACDSYTWIDSNTYTESNNTATFTLQNAAGCDSVVTLNLTINKSTIGTDVQAACDSYTWIDGNTYTESNNTATFTLTKCCRL